MKFTHTLAIASPLILLSVGNTFAEDRALYNPANVFSISKETVAELKITPGQEKGLETNMEKRLRIWRQLLADRDKVWKSKLNEKQKNLKLRALDTQASDDLFRVYGETLRADQVKRMKQIVAQIHGMEIFDCTEVRDALKIGDKEVKVLRAAYDKLAAEMLPELQAQIKAKKITREEAAAIASSMRVSVPDRVRESLSKEQQKVLADLLGEKNKYGKK